MSIIELNHSPSVAYPDTGGQPQGVQTFPLDDVHACADWLSMFERAPLANPYQHPAYVQAELDAAPGSRTLRPAMVRSGSDLECQGVGILVPKSVRTSQAGGIGPGWTMRGLRLVGGSFLTVDQSFATQSQLLSAAVNYATKVGAEFLLIEDLDEQSPLFQATQSAASDGCQLFPVRDIQARWHIDFPASQDDYWNRFSGRTRYAFRTRLKKIGAMSLERVTNADQIPDFLSAAHEISKQSWQSRQFGLRIRNDASELRQLSILARLGFLRSYLMRIDGQPAAFAVCHQHAGCFRYEEIAYCGQYSLLSPGETMLHQIIVDLFGHETPQVFDFGGGDGEYKRKFGNGSSRSQSVWLVPSTWRAGSSLAYLNVCRGLRSSARNAIKACGLATKARQWLRYGTHSAQTAVSAQSPANSVEASSLAVHTDSQNNSGQ